MRYYILFILLSLLFLSTVLRGASKNLHLLGVGNKQALWLRWAPSQQTIWQYAQQYGYRLERFTIIRDSVVLDKPEHKVLADTIRPAAPEVWEQNAHYSDQVIILAGILFGKKEQKTLSIAEAIKQTQRREQEFAFGLMAAENDFFAARLAALGYIDNEVNPKEKYFYRLMHNIPENLVPPDTALLFISPMDTAVLPPPKLFLNIQGHTVTLQWSLLRMKNYYFGYYVERSENGTDFKRLNKYPLVSLNKAQKRVHMMTYQDSLPVDGKNYYYRIRGTSTFGTIGQPSDTLKAKAKRTWVAYPTNIKIASYNKNKLSLSWDFPDSLNTKVRKFIIKHAEEEEEERFVTKGTVPPSLRSYEFTTPWLSSYTKVTALMEDSAEITSFAYFFQMEDSIPPDTPKNITGTVDTTGKVTLQWEANSEPDILGYRIYRTNSLKTEFVQLTVSPIEAPRFEDSLSLRTLGEKIYYQVIAVDRRYNMSAASPPVALKLPDVFPPSPPAFYKVKNTVQGPQLAWYPSHHKDVKVHTLYRKQEGTQEAWKAIYSGEGANSESSFIDSSAILGKTYLYTLLAKDSNGLESSPTTPVMAYKIDNGIRPPMKPPKLEVLGKEKKINIQWEWNSSREQVMTFELYRKVDDEKWELLSRVPKTQRLFTDKSLLQGKSYRYAIIALLNDGSQTKFSNTKSVIL